MNVRVAAVQLAAHDRADFAAVWPRIEDALRTALDEGARLVVLPEGTLPGYVLGPQAFEPAQIGRAMERCQELARDAGAVLVVGAARLEGERVRNSALVIDADGSIAGGADKHFLWHFDRKWFAPGTRIAPVTTRLGSIGALVCADGRIPLIARALVDRGAQILAMPTAWVTSGRDPAVLENAQADLLACVRARENGVPFVAANKCGVELGCVAYCGKSQIVTADGSIAICASQERQEIVSATLELQPPKPARADPPAPADAVRSAPESLRRIAITALDQERAGATRVGLIDADELLFGGLAGLRRRRCARSRRACLRALGRNDPCRVAHGDRSRVAGHVRSRTRA